MANFLAQILLNRIILICLLTWFISQSIKFFVRYAKHRILAYRTFLSSGGMPSSHSAVMMAFTTLMYMQQGISPLFLLSVMFLVLTVHDVLVLRRHTVEHAKIINLLSGKKGKKLEESMGHEPLDVLAGLVLGLVIALVLG